MKGFKLSVLLSITAFVMGCASSSEQGQIQYDKNNDPRVGEQVRQICHSRSVSGWSSVDNDRNALLMHMGNNETYKVSLIGACDPDWAMMGIAVISRGGSSCISAGDKIVTDAQPKRRSACSISRIYQWHDEVDTTEQDETVAENSTI